MMKFHTISSDPLINQNLSAVKITGELMLGFGQGTNNRNATEWNAESLNTLVSDTDSTTSYADCNSSVAEIELLEQEYMLGSSSELDVNPIKDDLGLHTIMDANDEIGVLVKEALMEFVMEE